MSQKLANTNESFDFLKSSSDFLNIILDNINSCVLLLDKDMRLHAFNDALKTIFSNKKDENLLYQKCGEAIGCAHQIEEAVECGSTTHCRKCDLRLSALESYANDEVIYKNETTKPSMDYNQKKVYKRLQFSTRLFPFEKEKYIIMIVEDITNQMVSDANSNLLMKSH